MMPQVSESAYTSNYFIVGCAAYSCSSPNRSTASGRAAYCVLAFYARNFVLCLGVEVARRMALVQLTGRLPEGSVDHAPALHGRSRREHGSPPLHVLVLIY